MFFGHLELLISNGLLGSTFVGAHVRSSVSDPSLLWTFAHLLRRDISWISSGSVSLHILEISFLTLNYFVKDIFHVLITADVVKGTSPPAYWKKGKAVHFWEEWATYENAYYKKQA